MDIQSFLRTRKYAIFAIALVAISSWVGAYWLAPLYVELNISLFGRETEAAVIKIETVERDDGERAWTVDLINYKFENPEGFVFTGVNDANSSQTESLIGRKGHSGNYEAPRVEYMPSHPQWHRLKGWGYGGLGPPGSLGWLIFRLVLVAGLVLFAYLYAYELIHRHGIMMASR
jgi:hypothetical protein